MDYTNNAVLTVVLHPTSPYQANPASLSSIFPGKPLRSGNAKASFEPQCPLGLSHVGPVGALPDVQVVSLPRSTWEQDKAAVLEALNRADGVMKVDVQEQKQRKKRDEF
ncbi:hypothetical protein PENSPDRAFT_683225 [Peniophora sp. CONT]|nr:hypothetical protein PENSPDRAFT_683225 [Peniophora sp. CONT]